MGKNPNTLAVLGLNDPEAAFKNAYERHGIPSRNITGEGRVSKSRQDIFRHAEVREKFKGFWVNNAIKAHAPGATTKDAVTKAYDESVLGGNTVGGAVPLVFDPDVLEILKAAAPLVERVPHVGQQGYKAVVNRISARDAPIGFSSEADAIDMSSAGSNEATFAQIEVDMEIYLDKVDVSDFTVAASGHYLDVRDTALGQRIAEHAQLKEKAMLYGDPAQATGTGGIGDADVYEGFAKIIDDAGNSVLKSSVDLDPTTAGTDKPLFEDIKSEIKDLLQGPFAVNKADLEIWTSHTLFDHLENEIEVTARVDENTNSINFGFNVLYASGVPIIASHSVDTHTDGAYTVGDEGDVFIMNRREFEFRELVPLSTVPLGRIGLSDRLVVYEFGAPILKGAGALCKWLQSYDI